MNKKTQNGSPTSCQTSRSFHLRRCAVLLIVLLLALLLYRGNTKVILTQYDLTLTNLPTEFDGFTVAHLSDLHNARFGVGQERLLSRVREADADVIVITGDMIDSRHTDVPLAVETLRLISEIAPVYLVSGNHEARIPEPSKELYAQAAEVGVMVLRNETVTLERSGDRVRLAGIDDLGFFVSTYGAQDGQRQFKTQLAELTDGNDATILLTHRPELYEWYAEAGADLVLAGHAHGGQMRLPWIGGLIAPGQGFLPKYTSGVHWFQNTQMVISRGLGNSVIPLRINNPPEVVAVTLHCEKTNETEADR